MQHSIGSFDRRKQEKPYKVVIRSQDDSFEIELFSWSTIHVLKEVIQRKTGIKLKDQRLFHENQELIRNNQNMFDYNISKGTVLYLTHGLILEKKEKSYLKPTERFFDLISPDLSHIIDEIRKAFAAGLSPQLTENGTSGTYLLKNSSRVNLAIFKPFDEEPYAENNPKGYSGKLGSNGFRPGIRSGESAAREVAAYLLDRKGFHNVPETINAELRHHYFKGTKYGSLQVFKKHHDIAGNFGPMLFSARDVRRIAMLDLRILNCDRNEENILVKKVSPDPKTLVKRNETNVGGNKQRSCDFELIPIDHGLSFPDTISICSYEIVWMEWPQIQQPFSKEEMEFINAIDPEEDVKFLTEHLKFRDICLRNFRIAEIVLKKCAKEGLSLYQIGTIVYKEDQEEQSDLEKIIHQAESMFEFTRKSVEQTIFVTNLIKKTRFMSKATASANFRYVCPEERKVAAKDDEFLVYGAKDRSHYAALKRRMHRNYSTRSNLNELEESEAKIQPPMQLFPVHPRPIIEEKEENESSSEHNENSDDGQEESPDEKKGFPMSKTRNGFGIKKNISTMKEPKKNIVKKVISMPNLLENRTEKPIKNGFEKKPAQYDEIFFYYFESFLDQFLVKKLNRKRLSSQG